MKQYIGHIILSAAILIAALIIRSSSNQRFEMIQRENNRMVLLDTKTGQFWDVLPGDTAGKPITKAIPLDRNK